MSIAAVIDKDGVAVITGGASGFGFDVAERVVTSGMSVAILDVSRQELADAEQLLRCRASAAGQVLAVACDVSKYADCQAAERAVASAFRDRGVSFLFNNAGIAGTSGGVGIVDGPNDDWYQCFSVNVFGAVHILKAFLPGMIQRGPLPSGKRTFVVTTSSVTGLLNHNPGPYSCSKMALTAMCEQLSIELQDMGPQAAHISPHALFPTVGATNFLTARGADGQRKADGSTFLPDLAGAGMSTAKDIVDGLFQGLDAGKHYVVVDHPSDIPTSHQLPMRMQDQVDGSRPRRPEQLGMMLLMQKNTEALQKRQEQLAAQRGKL